MKPPSTTTKQADTASPAKMTNGGAAPVEDIEVKDAQIIFQSIWSSLEEEVGSDNMRFPKEIFWLNGAPGAGKGTQTAFIMEFRDLTEKPIVVSELLKSPEARKKIDAGMLVGELKKRTRVLRNTHRFAGFAVLKAPDVPSVLLELGFLSNPKDERALRDRRYRARLAEGVTRAVDAYFARVEQASGR